MEKQWPTSEARYSLRLQNFRETCPVLLDQNMLAKHIVDLRDTRGFYAGNAKRNTPQS